MQELCNEPKDGLPKCNPVLWPNPILCLSAIALWQCLFLNCILDCKYNG